MVFQCLSSISLLIFCLLILTNPEKGSDEISDYYSGFIYFSFHINQFLLRVFEALFYIYTYLDCWISG